MMKMLLILSLTLLTGCQIVSGLKRPLARDIYLDTFLSAKEDNPHAQFLLGKRYLQEGKTSKAITHFEKALAEQPDRADFEIGLGAAYQSEKKWDPAEKAYLRALSLNPQSAQAMILLARLAWMRGDLNASKAWIGKAAQIDDSAELWKVKGEAAYVALNYDEALQDWKESLKRDPSQPLLQEIMADLQAYLGQKP